MNYILGGNGALGTALSESTDYQNTTLLRRNEYVEWATKPTEIKNYFENRKISEIDTFFVCAGLTDPGVTQDVLDTLNFYLPRNLLEVAAMYGSKIITFGSVLENLNIKNNYILSKRLFLNYLNFESTYRNFEHWQLHTLYGGKPPKVHMFLGQIALALSSKSKFQMTSGLQLREYWHVEDVANFIMSQRTSSDPDQIRIVGSGLPVTLRELAIAIFEQFHARDLLEIGVIEDPRIENYDLELANARAEAKPYMRDPVDGVINFLKISLMGKVL